MFLSLITKNLNLEILTKNLVTFKRWDEVKDSGSHEKLIYRRELPKKGGLDSLQMEGEGGPKRGEVLLRRGDGGRVIPQDTV